MTDQTMIVNAQVAKPALALSIPESQATAISAQALPPAVLLSIAVQQGADTQKLTELMNLQDRYEAKLARLAYSEAIVHFQAVCPVIIRTGFNDRFGNQYPQWSTAHVQIKQALIDSQLAVTHQIVQDDKGLITVIAECRHGPSGHIECNKLSAPPDRLASREGKAIRNEVQAIKSTITYLQCVTAFALLGLDSRDRAQGEAIAENVRAVIDPDDDDGNYAEPPAAPKPASESAVTDPEKETKRQFVAVCREKTGNPKLPNDTVIGLFENVQKMCASDAAQDCLKFISRRDVVVRDDGTICVTDPAASAPIDARDLPPWEDTTMPEAPAPAAPVARCSASGCGFLYSQMPEKGTICPQCGKRLGFRKL